MSNKIYFAGIRYNRFMYRSLPFLIILFIGLAFVAGAQPPADKSAMEKERQEIQKELKEIQQLYESVKGQKKQTLSQLNVLNRKISLQERYIGSISREIRSIDDDIYLSELEIYRLNKQLDTLRVQYARSVAYAYKNRSNYDYVNFIFSANSFNDAVKRISYLKSYRDYREKQVANIYRTQELIGQRRKQQLVRKEQKNEALDKQTKQVEELAIQKKEKSAVVNQLKSRERELERQIAAKKKRDRDLQNAVLAVVRREIELAKKEAEERKKAAAATAAATGGATVSAGSKPTTAPVSATAGSKPLASAGGAVESTSKRNEPIKRPDSYLDLNASDVALNSSFEANRYKIPWPVDNGIVVLKFGDNKIENTLLTIDNPGITIATPSAGSNVKAVFNGEVRGVYNLGDGMAVTIRHGKYFSTYSNLSNVSVEKGSIVKTGQVIGKTGRDDEGNGGQIDFILTMEARKIDPQAWLRK
ncbi:MAG: murein hydrolase activator EnvC family protein [Sphingomonadales bacterium]